ncbi:unnamed protein product [Closterium sp. NIES-54]
MFLGRLQPCCCQFEQAHPPSFPCRYFRASASKAGLNTPLSNPPPSAAAAVPLTSPVCPLTAMPIRSLGNNAITGAVANTLANLTSLETLWLFGNNLTGTIPSSLCNLTRMNSLCAAPALSARALSARHALSARALSACHSPASLTPFPLPWLNLA